MAIAWARFQPRTVALAQDLGGRAAFVLPGWLPGRPLVPLRYLVSALLTWHVLRRERPECVIVVTPPVFAPLVAWLWCLVHGRDLVVDCHSPGAFDSERWAWAEPLHRFLLRRARAVLLHSSTNLALVERWGVRGIFLVDDLPSPPPSLEQGVQADIVVAGSFDPNEPVAVVLQAARLAPDISFALTGDPRRLPRSLRRGLPPNVTLTGFLAYPAFMATLARARAVAVFGDDPAIHTPRAAFEAVSLGRPLVLLDQPGVRATFGDAARFTPAMPRSIAGALGAALREEADMAARSRTLAQHLRARREDGLRRLRDMLQRDVRRSRRVLMLTQHGLGQHCIVRRNVRELLERGFDVDLVCTDGAVPEDTWAGAAGRLRVYPVPIPHRRGGAVRYLVEYGAFFAFAGLIATGLGLSRRYEVVQTDNLPDILAFAALGPRLRGARVALNLFELTPEMIAAAMPGRRGRLLLRWAARVERAAVRWADRVIVVSEPCRAALRRRGAPEEKLAIVVNTTAWEGAAEHGEGPDARGEYLITHGTLVERYGTHLILDALALLRKRWPQLRLRVIGAGEQIGALVEQADQLGLQRLVTFTGRLPWSETLAEVRGARLGIVSVLADGYGELLLPTKLLEYARLSVPAVCPRLPAIEAYFPLGSVAYFDAGDAAGLAAQVDLLLGDPMLASVHARRAREVVDALGWDRMRDQYIAALGLGPQPGRAPAPARAASPGRELVGSEAGGGK